jgi:hypothetical protein
LLRVFGSAIFETNQKKTADPKLMPGVLAHCAGMTAGAAMRPLNGHCCCVTITALVIIRSATPPAKDTVEVSGLRPAPKAVQPNLKKTDKGGFFFLKIDPAAKMHLKSLVKPYKVLCSTIQQDIKRKHYTHYK